jgi:KipI family sensor histidine kinase inhibitor
VKVVQVVCHEYGDAALLVDLVADSYDDRWAAAQGIGQALRASPPTGLVDVVASYQNVFVAFDPLVTDHAAIVAVVEDLAGHPAEPAESRRFLVPVAYGGEAGPDLADVAELCGWSTDDVVAAHAGEDWVVRFVGSPVGAPMMDGPRLPLSIPRLATPRTRLVPGSVGVSGFQSIVYNAPSPGGWRVIGLTPARLFDLDRPPHVAYRSGDRFRFVPIDADDWDSWRRPLEVAR